MRSPRWRITWVPTAVALAIFVFTLILWRALVNRQTDTIAQTVEANAADALNRIVDLLGSRVRALQRMADRWEFANGTPEVAWEADARNCLAGFPGYQAIEWVDPSYHIRRVVPLEGNESVLNQDLTREARRRTAVETARQRGEPSLTEPIQLVQGGAGFILYVPIGSSNNFQGFIVGVFRCQNLFESVLTPGTAAGHALQLQAYGEVLFQRGTSDPLPKPRWIVENGLSLYGVEWELRVWPTPAQLARLESNLPEAVLATGCSASVLFALLIIFAQTASARSQQLTRLNRDLAQEMKVRQAAEQEREKLIQELRAALADVKTLSGLVPICAKCKSIRDDRGFWNQIEGYIAERSTAVFSHGLCPKCLVQSYTEAGFQAPPEVRAAAEGQDQRPS